MLLLIFLTLVNVCYGAPRRGEFQFQDISRDRSPSSLSYQESSSSQNQYSRSIPQNTQRCPPNHVLHIDGTCTRADITQNIFVYGTPIDSNPAKKLPPPNIPKPKIQYKVVVIKNEESEEEPIIIPPPQEKTVVLVLKKGSKGNKRKVIEVEAPESKPEVFFIDYEDGENIKLPGGIELAEVLGSPAKTANTLDTKNSGEYFGPYGNTPWTTSSPSEEFKTTFRQIATKARTTSSKDSPAYYEQSTANPLISSNTYNKAIFKRTPLDNFMLIENNSFPINNSENLSNLVRPNELNKVIPEKSLTLSLPSIKKGMNKFTANSSRLFFQKFDQKSNSYNPKVSPESKSRSFITTTPSVQDLSSHLNSTKAFNLFKEYTEENKRKGSISESSETPSQELLNLNISQNFESLKVIASINQPNKSNESKMISDITPGRLTKKIRDPQRLKPFLAEHNIDDTFIPAYTENRYDYVKRDGNKDIYGRSNVSNQPPSLEPSITSYSDFSLNKLTTDSPSLEATPKITKTSFYSNNPHQKRRTNLLYSKTYPSKKREGNSRRQMTKKYVRPSAVVSSNPSTTSLRSVTAVLGEKAILDLRKEYKNMKRGILHHSSHFLQDKIPTNAPYFFNSGALRHPLPKLKEKEFPNINELFSVNVSKIIGSSGSITTSPTIINNFGPTYSGSYALKKSTSKNVVQPDRRNQSSIFKELFNNQEAKFVDKSYSPKAVKPTEPPRAFNASKYFFNASLPEIVNNFESVYNDNYAVRKSINEEVINDEVLGQTIERNQSVIRKEPFTDQGSKLMNGNYSLNVFKPEETSNTLNGSKHSSGVSHDFGVTYKDMYGLRMSNDKEVINNDTLIQKNKGTQSSIAKELFTDHENKLVSGSNSLSPVKSGEASHIYNSSKYSLNITPHLLKTKNTGLDEIIPKEESELPIKPKEKLKYQPLSTIFSKALIRSQVRDSSESESSDEIIHSKTQSYSNSSLPSIDVGKNQPLNDTHSSTSQPQIEKRIDVSRNQTSDTEEEPQRNGQTFSSISSSIKTSSMNSTISDSSINIEKKTNDTKNNATFTNMASKEKVNFIPSSRVLPTDIEESFDEGWRRLSPFDESKKSAEENESDLDTDNPNSTQ